MGTGPAQNPVDQNVSPSSGSQRELSRQEGSVTIGSRVVRRRMILLDSPVSG